MQNKPQKWADKPRWPSNTPEGRIIAPPPPADYGVCYDGSHFECCECGKRIGKCYDGLAYNPNCCHVPPRPTPTDATYQRVTHRKLIKPGNAPLLENK